jgi:hypothetical protein
MVCIYVQQGLQLPTFATQTLVFLAASHTMTSPLPPAVAMKVSLGEGLALDTHTEGWHHATIKWQQY